MDSQTELDNVSMQDSPAYDTDPITPLTQSGSSTSSASTNSIPTVKDMGQEAKISKVIIYTIFLAAHLQTILR
jgi:hypothetical protein